MSGRGKGGKGLGKGGARRHRTILRDNIEGITKPAIRRLCRRGGVKRIAGLVYNETRGALKVFLSKVIEKAVTLTEHYRRKTVSAMDVVHALKSEGRTIYGFGDNITEGMQTKKPTMAERMRRDNVRIQNMLVGNARKIAQRIDDDQREVADAHAELKFMETANLGIFLMVGMFLTRIETLFKLQALTNITKIELDDSNLDDNKVVHILKYEIDKRYVFTSLKSGSSNSENNILYEYLIGRTVNLFRQTPNLLYTFSAYRYKTIADHDYCINQENLDVSEFKNRINRLPRSGNPEILAESCRNFNLHCFLQEYAPYFYTLNEMFDLNEEPDLKRNFWQKYAITSFFQLYSFCRTYKNRFTHYSLSSDNILLTYNDDYYYKFIYKENGVTIAEFDSPYLVKIIDYSKSVVYQSSEEYKDIVCNLQECAPDCGKEKGYENIHFFADLGINISEDLRVMDYLKEKIDDYPAPNYFKRRVKQIRFENDTQKLQSEGKYIENVEDCYQMLLSIMNQPTVENLALFGTFTIHTDIVNLQRNQIDYSFELN